MGTSRQARQTRTRAKAADEGQGYGSTGEIPHHLLVEEIAVRREQALRELAGCAQEALRLEVATTSLVAQARAEGQTWDAIAKALRLPRPTVYSRYAKVVGPLLVRTSDATASP